jgi:ATP-dependent DNA ligase
LVAARLRGPLAAAGNPVRLTAAAQPPRSSHRCDPQAFDLPELDGEDLRPLPLGKRKARLARLLARVQVGIAINEHTDEDGCFGTLA